MHVTERGLSFSHFNSSDPQWPQVWPVQKYLSWHVSNLTLNMNNLIIIRFKFRYERFLIIHVHGWCCIRVHCTVPCIKKLHQDWRPTSNINYKEDYTWFSINLTTHVTWSVVISKNSYPLATLISRFHAGFCLHNKFYEKPQLR